MIGRMLGIPEPQAPPTPPMPPAPPMMMTNQPPRQAGFQAAALTGGQTPGFGSTVLGTTAPDLGQLGQKRLTSVLGGIGGA